MKIKSLIKYGLRFILLQVVLSAVLIWYFDNYLVISQDQKFLIYLSLVDDWERFYPFFPLKYVTVDTVLVLMVFIFLFALYSTKFYTYVNELTYSFRKNYFDEFLSIYLLWCSFMFAFFLLFRIGGIYRSNLIFLTLLVPSILMIFRNSELLSSILGRSLFNENYLSFNLEKESSLRNLRILSFRNEVDKISIDFKNNPNQLKLEIEKANRSLEINLVVINIENLKKFSKDIEKYLVNLNKKVLIISNESLAFNSNFILRREKFENYFLTYFNNDIQYGAKFIIKRIFDILVSISALIILSPVWLTILIYISTVDGWPPIVIQNRVGLHGKVFRMYKFRTMYKEAHSLRDDLSDKNKKTGPLFKLDDDPRIIKGGKTIRRYSLDELPQLINVIRGNMSLVGPRPLFDTDRQYFKGGYIRRLNVMPGMTGLLQINDRNTDDFDVWFKYDLEYIEKWSLYLDFLILIKTVPSLFQQKVQGR